MNRDELLDKLAMELTEWPSREEIEKLTRHQEECRIKNGGWYFFEWGRTNSVFAYCGGMQTIPKEQWLARRTELINRPDDSEAPEWAEWVAQDGEGEWWWYQKEPHIHRGIWVEPSPSGSVIKGSDGALPSGHDWRKTLTRINRQPTEAQQHIVDAARLDSQFREAMAACKCTTAENAEDEAFQALDEKLGRQQASAPGILNAAALHMQDRASTYDKPAGERSMAATVDAFRATTGITLNEEQGWHFMALLKLVRSQQGDLRLDSYEDGAAYVALAGEAAAKHR